MKVERNKIFFRVDINLHIATGHLMRCLAIADAFKEIGCDVEFISADSEPENIVKARNFQFHSLESNWEDMEGEIEKLNIYLESKDAQILIVDSYKVTEKYFKDITDSVYTVYIDDLDAMVYDVNCIICYACYYKAFNYENRYLNLFHEGKITRKTSFLLGPKYAPLRNEFGQSREKIISKRVNKLLLMSGGADPYDSLGRILNGLDVDRFQNIWVICGRYNNKVEELEKEYKNHNSVIFKKNVVSIKEYMEQADLAISAGGSTLYELCSIGTPTISFSYADNQLSNVHCFDESGIISYAGDIRYDDVPKKARELMEILSEQEERRKTLSRAMRDLVDGRGAFQIAKSLTKGEKDEQCSRVSVL